MSISEAQLRGLETQNTNIRERLAKLEGILETNSKNEQKSKGSQLILPGLITLIFGALIGLYGLVYAQGNKITAILTVLQPQTALKNIVATISTEPQRAKKELTQVAGSIRQLKQAKLNLPEETIIETTGELTKISTAHENLPETWSLIGDFITYRSQMIRGWQETNLPRCDDQFHRVKTYGEDIQPTGPTTAKHTVTHGPVEIHDCKIVLDSPDTTANLSLDLTMGDVIFTHCAVFYNGGPIIVAPVKAVNSPNRLNGSAYFKDCLFVISLPQVPDERGREFARELLTSPSGDIKLPRSS